MGYNQDFKNHHLFASNTSYEKGLVAVGLVILGLLAIAIGTMVTVSVRSITEKPHYEEVATCLTESYLRGPVVFEDEIYVCTGEHEGAIDLNESEPLGYFTFKGGEINWLYISLTENFVYVDEDHTYLAMHGSDRGHYIKASVAEGKGLDEYSVFMIEPTARDDRDVRIEIDEALVTSIEETYGVVDYKLEDFKDYDACYTLMGYTNQQWAESESHHVWPGFIGCILVVDGKYYYGNRENNISGELLENLLKVI